MPAIITTRYCCKN